MDDKYIFYSKLDENHRARTIYRHKIGDFDNEDELIFEEKSEEQKQILMILGWTNHLLRANILTII